MRVKLRVIAGPQTGRVFTFEEHETFMIGRSQEAQFCLPQDCYFSRHHCLLEIAPPQCFLRDLHSTNGTFVNGIRVETAHLKNGDRIQGGETVLEVEVSGDISKTREFQPQNSVFTSPTVVTVKCLNCGLSAKTDSSQANTEFSFLCDECREKLKNNPQPIPGYEMIRVLGKGGMGSVMLARRVSDGRSVAIKTLLPEVAVSEKSLKRFMREIEVAASLRHPNIVGYVEHGTYNGTVYLVSEFVNGMDASKFSKQQGGKLGYREVVIIMEQILAALNYAHSLGYVHRDIKEQNILVASGSVNYNSKLTDFGLSKSFRESGMSGVTVLGEVAGTIAYMPPEQIRDYKEVRPPSDIYAAGMTAYRLLSGRHAFDINAEGGISEMLKAIFEKPFVPLVQRVPYIPYEVAAVIEKSIAKEVNARWSTAGEMRDALIKAMNRS
jgi:serine/threonine-protein kinase